MRPACLGVDLGTSSVKVVALGLDGRLLAEATRSYPIRKPFPSAAEASTGDWWQAISAAVRELTARHPDLTAAALAVDGQMHGLVLADAEGTAIRPAITWADGRATTQAARWRSLPDQAAARLANPVVPGMTGPLLAWLADNEPGNVHRADAALLPKDWVRVQLTGLTESTDPSDASATLLWDAPADTWDRAILPAVGVPARLLPTVIPSAARAGELTAAAAAALGLTPGIPVAAGAADTAAAMLALGIRPGQTLVTVGTGGQVVRPVSEIRPVARPVTHLYRTAAPSGWYAMAAIQNFGLALDWVRELLGADWDELYAAAAGPPSDAVFLPFLTGERTPLLDPAIRGAWAGLDLRHTRADLLHAAVAGVCCALRHALDALPGPRPPSVLLAGGGSRHRTLRQLLASVFGLPVIPVRLPAASAIGAARLAAAAAGLPLADRPPELERPVDPAPDRQRYEDMYRRYLAAVPLATKLSGSGRLWRRRRT